jgi:hypothetical protein
MDKSDNTIGINKSEPDFTQVPFAFDAYCTKAWQDDAGKMRVRAIASDDQLDLQRDRMSHDALERMAEMSRTGVPLLENHRGTFGFGKTVDGRIITTKSEDGRDVRQLLVELELDGDYPQARSLFREVAGGDCQKQLSIGGKLNLKNRDAVTVQMTAGGLSRTINDLDLDHIATTRMKHAANPRTSFVEAIAKALDSAEEAGWTWPQESLAKQETAMQNTPINMDSDIQAGARLLANLGKLAKDEGYNMNGEENETPGMTPDEQETTPGEPASPEMAMEEKGYGEDTPNRFPAGEKKGDSVADPKTMPEQAGLEPDAKKYGANKSQAESLLGEISVLLSKMEAPEDEMADDEMPDEMKALVEIRDRLDKMIQGAASGPGEKPSAEELAGHGAGAYEQDTSAAKPGYSPDKAPKGDSTDVGGSHVTGHENDIQVGGEIEPTAPGAQAAYKHTMSEHREAHAGITKALGEGGVAWLNKTLDDVAEAVIEKNTELTQDIVVAAVEKMLEENAGIEKAISNYGNALNDATRRLAQQESELNTLRAVAARVERLEKAGGFSQSGPRGAADSTVQAPTKEGGLWSPLFKGARDAALGKY